MPELAMVIAAEFRQQQGVTRREFHHLLHGQLVKPWNNDERAGPLCQALLERVQACAPMQLLELLAAGRDQPSPEGAITFTAVLGYEYLADRDLSFEQLALVRAAAAVLCRLGDVFDAEALAARQVSRRPCTCSCHIH